MDLFGMDVQVFGNGLILLPVFPAYVGLAVLYIYRLYTPQTQDLKLPFRVWKGSRAALEGVAREHEGALGEHRGSKERVPRSTIRQCRSAAGGRLKWISSVSAVVGLRY